MKIFVIDTPIDEDITAQLIFLFLIIKETTDNKKNTPQNFPDLILDPHPQMKIFLGDILSEKI